MAYRRANHSSGDVSPMLLNEKGLLRIWPAKAHTPHIEVLGTLSYVQLDVMRTGSLQVRRGTPWQ